MFAQYAGVRLLEPRIVSTYLLPPLLPSSPPPLLPSSLPPYLPTSLPPYLPIANRAPKTYAKTVSNTAMPPSFMCAHNSRALRSGCWTCKPCAGRARVALRERRWRARRRTVRSIIRARGRALHSLGRERMSGVCWVYWKGWGSWSGKMGGMVVAAVVGLNSACRLGFLSDWVR